MTTYINKNWTKRNYECTNVVMQITDQAPRDYNGKEDTDGHWVEVDASEVADIETLCGCTFAEFKGFEKIGGFGAHSFFGYM